VADRIVFQGRKSGMKIWLDAFGTSLRSRLFLILAGVSALYIVAGYWLASVYDWPVALHTQIYSTPMKFGTMWFVLGLITWRCVYIMIAERPDRLTVTILKDLRDHYFTPQKIANGIPVVLLFAMMFSVFTSFKSMIPVIHPFAFDPLFARIDKALHFGHHPWEILFPVFKIAALTTFLSFIYKTWFVAKFSVLYWQAFSVKRPLLREQFFITYILTWIINGTVLATLLSSAGPCFYGAVTGLDDPYAKLMAFLQESDKISPVWDLFAQNYLWNAYQDVSVTLFSGISAMPSMHISLAFLFALVGWRVGKKTGIFFTVYLVLMLIGSVHLGWHYAIDGYLGMLTTYLIWKAVGWALKNRPEAAATDHARAGMTKSSE
jgi:hypothetical protein